MNPVSKWLSTKTVTRTYTPEFSAVLLRYQEDNTMYRIMQGQAEEKDYELLRWPKVFDIDEVIDHEPSEEFKNCTDVVTRNGSTFTIEMKHSEFVHLLHAREAYVESVHHNFNSLLAKIPARKNA